MRIRRRKRVGPKKVKVPQVEFDMKAIKEIKDRKKKVCTPGSKEGR